MNSNYLKEYNNHGKLVFIVDKRTAKGFHVKDGASEFEIENSLDKIWENESIKRDLSKTPVNRLIAFNSEVKPKKISIFLSIIYLSLVILILIMHTARIFKFSNLIINITESNVKESLIGLIIFISGAYLIHEFSHVLIARLQGIYIKKMGFRIRYFLFPILFVRVFPTSCREKKINIAFVGLVSDLFLLILYNSFYVSTTEIYMQIALNLQFLMTIFNYNIFLPTDFANSIFQYFNQGNFRNQAFIYVKSLFSKQESNPLKI